MGFRPLTHFQSRLSNLLPVEFVNCPANLWAIFCFLGSSSCSCLLAFCLFGFALVSSLSLARLLSLGSCRLFWSPWILMGYFVHLCLRHEVGKSSQGTWISELSTLALPKGWGRDLSGLDGRSYVVAVCLCISILLHDWPVGWINGRQLFISDSLPI